MDIPQFFLDPAAGHGRQHHAQGHDAGAHGVKDGFIFTLRNHDHVHRVGGKAETVAELLESNR